MEVHSGKTVIKTLAPAMWRRLEAFLRRKLAAVLFFMPSSSLPDVHVYGYMLCMLASFKIPKLGNTVFKMYSITYIFLFL